jgi:hypothetical protein
LEGRKHIARTSVGKKAQQAKQHGKDTHTERERDVERKATLASSGTSKPSHQHFWGVYFLEGREDKREKETRSSESVYACAIYFKRKTKKCVRKIGKDEQI